MQRSPFRIPYRSLIGILIVLGLAIWLDLPQHPGIHLGGVDRDIATRLGLDLVGGTQTLLEADLPADTPVDPTSMETARTIVENRVNGLGVAEAVVQIAGDRRIVVELPGVSDPEEAVATIKETALLEFLDFSSVPPELASGYVGLKVDTDFGSTAASPTPTPSGEGTPSAETPVFHTVMTGADLVSVGVTTDPLGEVVVSFELSPEGAAIFRDYTASHIGQVLAIALDKEIISAPQIQDQITEGRGIIQGNFTVETANNLAVQLRYGSLPIPLKVVETRTIGPTLGQDSLRKSLAAGAIGLTIVMCFMAIYYRLPGLVADLSILSYGAIIFALFRTIPVTLTLAGIAGLMLSTGSALDANILIFERMKEELRAGKPLHSVLELGWQRAWPSIRDSNFATLITSAILFWFGSAFGATIVKGFAVTLFIGVVVSLFSAIMITRSFLTTALAVRAPRNFQRGFGL